MRRLELARVRVCKRCGRGRAELGADDGTRLTVRLDPVRAREVTGAADPDGVRTLTDVLLKRLGDAGVTPTEVVLDVAEGGLRALLCLEHAGETEVVSCTAAEGLALMVRGALRLYATDEAATHGASGRQLSERRGGPGSPGTLH